MDQSYWQKQTKDNPLFANLLWSRPENRLHAGKLLIIGGSNSGFKAPADAYRYATKAGIGTARILLPDSLRKTVGEVFLEIGEYAPSTPSGSFSYKSFAELLMHSQWADGVLLAGDFGRNSETAQLLEYFVNKYKGLLVVVGDAIDFFLDNPEPLLQREQTVLCLSFSQLQKIGIASKITTAFTSNLSLQVFTSALHELEQSSHAAFITAYEQNTLVAADEQISSTTMIKDTELELAAAGAVWVLQNPSQIFQALTTSLVD